MLSSDITDIDAMLTALLGTLVGLAAARQYPLAKPAQCPQQPYLPPVPGTEYFDTDHFKTTTLQRLIGAVQHPTQMYDDMVDPLVGTDPRWDTFPPWHEYLRQTYPLVHESTKLELVGGYSLVYTFEGSTDAKPIMLTGHQDVVVASLALDQWVYPPFEGHFDGEWLWGRGSSDCKNNVIGLLSVLERLIETGFKPRRTIILAFGQDEEASGLYGATRIATLLEERYGKNGIELILDEGGNGLNDEFGTLMALPALAEKGYADLSIKVKAGGGHSSVPAAHTSIGYLARFIVALEDAPLYHPVLAEGTPYHQYLTCVAEHGRRSMVPLWLPSALERGDLELLAEYAANQSLNTRYMIQTSKAATVVHGGIKSNALPEEASVVFNSRIRPGQSASEHVALVTGVVEAVAKQYDLAFSGSEGKGGQVELTVLHSSEPSPLTSTKGEAWGALSSAIRTTFGPETVASPSIATSNTDTRHYWNLSDSIFRWSPARIGTRLNAHTVNERLKFTSHIEGIKLYYSLIMRLDAMA